MENMESDTVNNPANNLVTSPAPKGKTKNVKIILGSIAGAIILLAAFFLIEKQTNLVGIFRTEEDANPGFEEEDVFGALNYWSDSDDPDDSEDSESSDTETKLKNTGDLALSGLSEEQYVLAVAFLEEELTEREPESAFFVLDNTSLAYATADFDTKDATNSIGDVEALPEDNITDMNADDSSPNIVHGYSTISFDIYSSSHKAYKVTIDTGGNLSDFKEILVVEH